MRRYFSILLAIVLAYGSIVSFNVSAFETGEFIESNETSINSAYLDVDTNSPYYNIKYGEYLESIKDLSEEEYKQKLLIAPSKYCFNESAVVDTSDTIMRSSSLYPSQYDSISALGLNVKAENQGDTNLDVAWAFGANDALEIYLKKNNMDNDCEFSEQHLTQSISKYTLGSEYSQYGVAVNNIVWSDFDAAAAYWTRGMLNGPVTQGALPYNINKREDVNTLLNCKKLDFTVTDTIDLSCCGISDSQINTRISLIKSLIMEYGAVYINYEHYDGAFNSAVDAYNNNDRAYISDGNYLHNGVVIIGWDDNYDINNFGDSKPDKKGAFIVEANRKVDKNKYSLDAEPRLLGRYYLSYNMTRYFDDYGIVSGVKVDSDTSITYEYDTTQHISSKSSYSTETSNIYANKYVKQGDMAQVINSITTYCEVPGSKFRVFVSADGTMQNLEEVKLDGVSLGNGQTSTYMGYVTLNLEQEVKINSDFMVAIEVTNSKNIKETIPQDINRTDSSPAEGRCFVSTDIATLKNGIYEDCGSNNNIIKVHVDYADREWKFDDSTFSELQYSTLSSQHTISGLTVNSGVEFSASKKSFKGTYLENYALLYKSTDKSKNSFCFPVNGESNIYFAARSNDDVSPRRLAIYSTSTKSTEYITLTKAKGYEYKYRGGPGNLYVYSVDDKVRIYSIAVNKYNPKKYQPLGKKEKLKWNFSGITNGKFTLTDTTVIDDMTIFATEMKPVDIVDNQSTSKDGYRYYYGLDLNGSGNNDYRTISVPIRPGADIYITARSSGTDDCELYVTNKYYCDLDSDLEKESITVSHDIKTYKFEYYGEGEQMYLRSKDNGIRIINIVEKPRTIDSNNEHTWKFDNIDDLTIGTVLTNYTFDDLTILGSLNRPATIVNSSSPEFSKAVELVSDIFESNSKLMFNVCDSRGTSDLNPVRKIRVKAKSNNTNLKLILGDEDGYVIGSYKLSNEMQEYVFDYSGASATLYLFTYNGDDRSKTEIYSISTSDIDYNTDSQTVGISRNSNDQGRCILSVDNIPILGAFKFILDYDTSELAYNNIHLGNDESGQFITDDNLNISSNENGKLVFKIEDMSKYEWSGILASVTFDFIGDVTRSNVTFSAQRVFD